MKELIEIDLDDFETPPRQPTMHICSVCGAVELWGPTWSWYGSLLDEDYSEPVPKFCSKTCADQIDSPDDFRLEVRANAGLPLRRKGEHER